MKKRFLIHLAYITALCLLIVSGLSCSSWVIDPSRPIDDWLPETESKFKSYITPECPSVKEALRDILGEPPYELSQAGFDDIRDWVAINIDYTSDAKRWDKDYWQIPEETMSYLAGDCEDFAILLCSLLRAYGVAPEQVYVALGVDGEEEGHAFLIEDWNNDSEWRRIESQATAQFSSWHSLFGLTNPDSRLDEYGITAAFNDRYCHDESFPWDEYQTRVWTLSDIATAVGNIADQFSQLLKYLLGLLFN